jgi:hypothetical protein
MLVFMASDKQEVGHPRASVDRSSEPPIMWPSSDSGFEADPFSPAGTAERECALTQRLGRRPIGKLVVWLILAVIIMVPSLPC